MLKPKKMKAAELEATLARLKVLRYRAGNQIKVALDESSNDIYKRFPLKKGSLYRRYFRPTSKQFINNSLRANTLGFKSVQPKSWHRGDDRAHDMVVYPSMPGNDIYKLAERGSVAHILPLLARYIAQLHARHIYFKAGHCGNFLYTDDQQFAIIDTDNMRFRLGWRRRAKCLYYLFNHAERQKVNFLNDYTHEKFLQDYLAEAKLSKLAEKYLRKKLRRYL